MDLFDTLIPIIIFIIWVIAGIGASARKKAKRGSSPVKSAAQGSPPPGGMGELKKTIRKVLEEMQVLPGYQEMESIPTEREIAETTIQETAATAAPEHATATGESIYVKDTVTTGESRQSLETTARKTPVRPISTPQITPKKRKIPLSEVRRGIIWSEILQKPVGSRE